MNKTYEKKYLKYKTKYFKLKQMGGNFINSTKELENTNIGTELDKEKLSKIYKEIIIEIQDYKNKEDIEKIIIPNEEIKSQILESGNLNEIISYDRGFAWVINYDKIYIDADCKTEIFCNYKLMYYIVKRYTLAYNYFAYEFKLKLPPIDLLNSNEPIEYPLIGSIYNTEIDLFNSIYNKAIIVEIVGPIIKDYFFSLKTKFKSSLIDTQFKSSLIDTQLLYMDITKKEDKNFKIHMCVKLEKIFWVIKKLLENLHQFENYIYAFKIDLFFPMYRLANQFANRSNYKDTYILNGEIYKTEEEQPPNIVFYPLYSTFNNDVHIYTKSIIDILKNLFPDELNITSGLFPRSNFRINDSIFFAVGDFTEKKKIPEKYNAPIDYNPNNCLNQDEKKCIEISNHTKNISNYELCKYENNQCMPNNINGYKSLIYKDGNFIGKTTREIYKMVGQENIYDILNNKSIKKV
jgi:hypothetical protein